jgi:hypothetical protein
MPHPHGHYLPLSLPRRFICDLTHFAKQTPTVPMERRMSLAPLVAAREVAAPRPSWCAIFLKAYALVAERQPILRRSYISFPWPRLYEHPINVASVGIERRFGDEDAVFFVQVRSPEKLSLPELSARLRQAKEEPIENISHYRRILRVSSLPRPLRRLAWWLGLHASGHWKAKYLGTQAISVVAGLGAAGLHLLSPLTTALNYGVFEDDGSLAVRLTYDHRVLDGGTAARTLEEMESVLLGEIVNELRYLEEVAAAA